MYMHTMCIKVLTCSFTLISLVVLCTMDIDSEANSDKSALIRAQWCQMLDQIKG